MALKYYTQKEYILNEKTLCERVVAMNRQTPEEVRDFIRKILANFTFIVKKIRKIKIRKLLLVLVNYHCKKERVFKNLALQTVPPAILFFPDEVNACIERGFIEYSSTERFLESEWICFSWDGIEYVYHPAFAILAPRERYEHYFKLGVLNDEIKRVSAKEINGLFFAGLKEHIKTVNIAGLESLYPWYWGSNGAYIPWNMSAYVQDLQ